MNEATALLLTFITGLFILAGTLITFLTKNSSKFVEFSIAMGFGVIVSLVSLELIPEASENLGETLSKPWTFLTILGIAVLGILILKGLDHFVPDHEEAENNDKNLYHIGIVASIALILHNIIEGMAIYSSVRSSLDLGIFIMLGVGLHNIPMGMVITSTLSKANHSKKTKVLWMAGIVLSTFVGGLIMFGLSNLITDFVLGILLSLTLGMLIYILLFELLGEMLETKHKNVSIAGLMLGMIIFIVSTLFE